jgi:hypothetical protein
VKIFASLEQLEPDLFLNSYFMGGRIALELMHVVGLQPARKNLDEVKIDVEVNACHGGLLTVVTWFRWFPSSASPDSQSLRHCTEKL